MKKQSSKALMPMVLTNTCDLFSLISIAFHNEFLWKKSAKCGQLPTINQIAKKSGKPRATKKKYIATGVIFSTSNRYLTNQAIEIFLLTAIKS